MANQNRIPFSSSRTPLTQAKTLTKREFDGLLKLVKRDSPRPLRDEALIRLSFYCGLRVQEIAGLRWRTHILTATGEIGEILHVTSDIGKMAVAREVPMDGELRKILARLRRSRPEDEFVIYAFAPERKDSRAEPGSVHPNSLAQYMKRLYRQMQLEGCTSHSGRRTFVTLHARQANLHGCSLKDVQALCGHKRLETTAGYMEPSSQQRKLVEALF